MDIDRALNDDHAKAIKLFMDLEEISGKNSHSRDKLFTQLKDALEAHSEAEEEVFISL